MNKSLFLLFILILIFSGCDTYIKKSPENTFQLQSVIKNIIGGIDTTHSSLNIFRDNELPPAKNPNKIIVDSIKLKSKYYYTVIAEYPNPLYNRFAILDNNFNVRLLDKSLNGFLSLKIFNSGKKYISINEKFSSKGVIGLRRVSFYYIDGNGNASLVFRTFTDLEKPGIHYSQTIFSVAPNEILTVINYPDPENEIIKENDRFLFDNRSNKFVSTKSIFDSLVLNIIENFEPQTDKPEMVSRKSTMPEAGTIPVIDNKTGSFSLPLSDQWDEIKNVKVTLMLKKLMTGIKYINNKFGAEITVVQLPANDSSENYINYPLINVSSGNYRVRFTEKISEGIYFYQFFEYSCKSEKFLLILQTLKSTYETYISDYQNLINSFSMGCL